MNPGASDAPRFSPSPRIGGTSRPAGFLTSAPEFGIIYGMGDCKKILYGVSDYARIRKENGWFIDRTGFIRDLENTAFAMFLRPRRFGKSLLISILQSYYDVNYKDRFEELFSGTDIGAKPTDERGRYLVMYFNFSAVSKDVGEVQRSFDEYTSICIDAFANRYRDRLPSGLAEAVTAMGRGDCNGKLSLIMENLRDKNVEIYVLIDEYDNFTNTILAESGQDAYDRLTHGEGFFKQFFTSLKAATSATDSPVKRMFITGVSPVTMDDVTSGFNIATNISTESLFSGFVGFTHADVDEILDYFAANAGFDFDREKAKDIILWWYDGYRFASDENAPLMANTSLVLNFLSKYLRNGRLPDDLVDSNLRTDYAKIRHLVTVGRRLNGNFSLLEGIIQNGGRVSNLVDSFQARDMSKPQNFVSLLYYFGMLSIRGSSGPLVDFTVPNETVRGFMGAFVPSAYEEIGAVNPRIFDLTQALAAFSEKGEWKPVMDILATLVRETMAVRDKIEGEKFVQATMIAYLRSAVSAYFVRHEYEANGGYADLLLEPDLLRYPGVKHALLMEIKYVGSARKPGPKALAAVRKEASKQLKRYAASHDLARSLRLAPKGDVKLTRLSVVFHGGNLVLCSEI